MQINITGEVLVYLKHLRVKLAKELGGDPTWNMVIKHLIDCYKDTKKLHSKVISKEKQIETMHEKTENYLVLSLQRPSAPVMAMQQNNAPGLAPPPPPPSLGPPKPLKVIEATISQDVKNDFLSELSQICSDGVIRKPSEILQATNPDHDGGKIEDLEEYQKRYAERRANPKEFGNKDINVEETIEFSEEYDEDEIHDTSDKESS